MKTQFLQKELKISAVKLGVSRQIAIPKKFYDKLGLAPGDYFDIEIQDNKIILTPKVLIDIDLAEGLKDIREGRFIGPFKTVKEAMNLLT